VSIEAKGTKRKVSQRMVHELANNLSDNIRESVVTEIEWDPEISSTQITVTADDGVVTLSGIVRTYSEKVAAEKASKRVYGTRGVLNEIKVEPCLSRTDPEILNSAIQVLRNDLRVPDENIRITVKRAWVTLEGWVERQFQKAIAEAAVNQLPGLRGVTDLIKVRPAVLPVEVKAKIEDAFRRNADLDARRVAVEANGGSVRLSGSVRSWSQRQAAELAAWAAPGVSSVENYITVVPEHTDFRDKFNQVLDGKVQSSAARTFVRASRTASPL
jgi:osmotically-inducible protein OsmY